MPRNRLSAVFDLWFLWHKTFLNSSSFLPLVVKHLFEYRAFRCGEYEYIPYAKKCQGYFSFFLDFFDFFFARPFGSPLEAALRVQGPEFCVSEGSFCFGMTGHVVQDGSILLTKIAVSEHGNDRGVLECVGGRLFWDGGGWFLHRPFDWAQGPDGGGIAFFLWWMTRELQISARQGLEGRAQPVPAGVRSATRGMEPEGGTPESA